MNYKIIYTDELSHHGIKGMKWGVRRYQNYDGSYTRAGLKRYNTAMDNYDEVKSRYDANKRMYKALKKHPDNQMINLGYGSTDGLVATRKVTAQEAKTITKDHIQRDRQELKKAKQEVSKHYDHLKQDKLGDEGKIKYANGKTINGGKEVNNALASIGGLMVSAAASSYVSGSLTSKQGKTLAAVGAAVVGAALVKGTYEELTTNRQLRAYYSHTSNY